MSQSDRVLAAAGLAALVLAVAAGWVLMAPADAGGEPADLLAGASALPGASGPVAADVPSSPEPPASLVVDVEGGVAEPGIQRLPGGSRVADAIAAAGGYGSRADLHAAATQLNLAKPLTDGEQVYVPLIGDVVQPVVGVAGPDASGGTPGGGGLVNLNTATPEELDALPGIGPVTVQKIVAARQEAPFASLDDAVVRGVMNRGQLEDIRDLATAG